MHRALIEFKRASVASAELHRPTCSPARATRRVDCVRQFATTRASSGSTAPQRQQALSPTLNRLRRAHLCESICEKNDCKSSKSHSLLLLFFSAEPLPVLLQSQRSFLVPFPLFCFCNPIGCPFKLTKDELQRCPCPWSETFSAVPV